ncbi:hypothetical protein NQ318_002296 [Aromia moschata]|uniref:Glucose-methanol-choline oxidoreductase N-terminal domain-containing protein n=1 Tax=Aromia moschata TaxID=1265417 RepID=A0AAV8Z4R4_9CUCU|nr:hypothetical protein NQ318_002296 [Aromia moschata]
MGSSLKLSSLLLCVAVAASTTDAASASVSPFQLVEDYVNDFRDDLQGMRSWASHQGSHREDLFHEDVHHEKYDPSHAIPDHQEYDFIIVGSGASGSAIANRLSEVPEFKVLLLEAGEEETTITQVPAMQPYLRSSHYTWEHITVLQNHSCLAMEHQQCHLGKGKALGGDTATNDMLYIRGHPKDYDIWADTGLIGWCWESVKPYFKLMEDAFAEDLDRKEHHYGGPIHLENFQHSTPITSYFLQAANELGIKKIDYNGKERLGLGIPQVTTKFGKRNSASQCYLAGAFRRKNLTIKPLSRVLKVLISTHTKEATGVLYLHEGHTYVAKAHKEVILSAGAINTAHLLMLSGIGPKDELEHLHIPVLADLMVGHNFKDHLSFIGLNFVIQPSHGHHVELPPKESNSDHMLFHDHEHHELHHDKTMTHDNIKQPEQGHHDKIHYDNTNGDIPSLYQRYGILEGHRECDRENDIVEYLKNRKGPLTTTGLELVGFLKTEHSRDKTDYPDVGILVTRNLYNKGYEQLHHLHITKPVYDAVWHPLEGKEGFTVEVVLLHPKSKGYLHLQDADPLHPPLINPEYLTDEDDEDVETILAGIHKVLKLAQTEHFKKLGAVLAHNKVPGCEGHEHDDHYWRCAIRHLSVSARQVSGTARMGVETDKYAVVDKSLNVNGVHNLRVADASVIPVTISGNLMAAEYMIGEHAADIITKDWLK